MTSLLSPEGWRALLALCAAAGVLYFAAAKRRVDFFTLGFVASVVYFIPGFVGYALRANERGEPYQPDVLDVRVYPIMVAVLVVTGLTAAFYDRLRTPVAVTSHTPVPPRTVLWAVLLLGALAGVMTVATTGRALLAPTKFEIIPHLNRWIVIVHYAAAVSLVLAAQLRSWRGLVAASVLLIPSLLVGARSVSALALMAVAMVWLSRRPRVRFVRAHRGLAALGAAAALFFFVSPHLFWMAKSGEWDLLRERIVAAETWSGAFRASEPFVIQENLNQILKSGLSIPAEDLWSVAAVAVPFYTELWPQPRSFEDRFHPVLFPDLVQTSLIGNYWAQAWALGGWLGVGGFLALYVGGLWVGSRLLLIRTPILESTAAIAFSYFAFYAHRNELAYLLILMRGHALVALFGVLVAWVTESFARRSRPASTNVVGEWGPSETSR